MPEKFPRDRFDDVARDKGRVGAHRAENPRVRGWSILLWASLAAVVLFVAGVFGALVMMDKISFGGDSEAKPVATTGAVQASVDTTYTVLILNASGDEAHTETVKQQLRDAGWADTSMEAIPSDESDFPTTTIYYALAGDEGPALGLAGVVGTKHIEENDVYQMGDVDASLQLTVVIGTDFGSAE